MRSGSLWIYYRDEVNNDTNEGNDDKTITCRSFEYKTNIIGSTPADNKRLDAEVVVPLKYLINF